MFKEDEWVTVEIELDADLVDQVAKILKPMGLAPDDYFQMCINFMGNPANREKVEALFMKCLAEGDHNNNVPEK